MSGPAVPRVFSMDLHWPCAHKHRLVFLPRALGWSWAFPADPVGTQARVAANLAFAYASFSRPALAQSLVRPGRRDPASPQPGFLRFGLAASIQPWTGIMKSERPPASSPLMLLLRLPRGLPNLLASSDQEVEKVSQTRRK